MILAVRVANRFGKEDYIQASDARHAVHTGKPPTPDFRHFVILRQANGRTIASSYLFDTYSRKVRAPVDRLPGNPWAWVA